MTLSLKAKLTILQCALFLILFLSLGIAVHIGGKRIIYNNIKEKLQLNSNDMAFHIQHYFSERAVELENIVLGRPVEVYFKKFQEPVLVEYFTNHKHTFPLMSYVNEQGIEEVKTIKGEALYPLHDINKAGLFERAMASPNRVIVSSAGVNADLGTLAVQMAVVRKDYFGDRFMGMILGTFPVSRIEALISERELGESMTCTLLDTNGIVLSSPRPDTVQRKLAGAGEGYGALLEGIRSLKPLFSEVVIDGLNSLVALAPIPDSQWSVMVAMPLEIFMQDILNLRKALVYIFLGIFLIGLMLTLVTANRIVRPLTRLTKTAIEIGKGRFDVKLDIPTRDEIGILAESFMSMQHNLEEMTRSLEETGQELQILNENLEEEVQKRTSELYASNQQLKKEIKERIRVENERKKLEAHLAQAQRMEAIGTLAGGTAHNFNNLLMGIQGNISLMLFDKEPGDPDIVRLNSIKSLVKDGARLTSQLLGYARQGSYEVKPLDLNQLVRQTSETFRNTRKEIRVWNELADNLPKIVADQEQIELTLLNLYLNAADAMPKGGDLYIKTSSVTHEALQGKPFHVPPGRYVQLEVRDTGMGMDEETMNHIFEPFFTTKGLAQGTGLGLSSVHGIVKAGGGFIDVESEKGQGTTFKIYLSASEQPTDQTKGISKASIGEKRTALLVDDESMVLEVGVEMLKKLGYEVLSASGGQEAVSQIERHKGEIDIVILDVIMPDMSGEITYEGIKEIDPEVKVLLSSGYGLDDRIHDLMKRGCAGFIQKPFDLNDLSHKLMQTLDNV